MLAIEEGEFRRASWMDVRIEGGDRFAELADDLCCR